MAGNRAKKPRRGRRVGWGGGSLVGVPVSVFALGIAAVMAFIAGLLWPSAPALASPATIICRGAPDSRRIALTFDDNTISAPSLETLKVLREYTVPATLFVTGNAIEAFPDVTEEILRGMNDGLFEVGDHTATHPDLTTLPAEELPTEIGGGTDAFRRLTGAATVPLFRPPYGRLNSRVSQVAGDLGFSHVVLWDVGTEDWTGESAQVIEQDILSHAHNGAIVLLHMGAANTAAALPAIVTRLRAAGYELVTVSRLLPGARIFDDVDSATEVGTAVAYMYDANIMNGYDARHFGPANSLTRAQAAKVISLATSIHTGTIEHPEAPSFSDVRPVLDPHGSVKPYPYDFVEEVAAAGLIEGSAPAGSIPVFRPNASLTRTQMAQIVARMARQFKGYPDPASEAGPVFSDAPDYALADLRLAASLGLVTGQANGLFEPWKTATRGQMAMVMSRFLDLPTYDPG